VQVRPGSVLDQVWRPGLPYAVALTPPSALSALASPVWGSEVGR
jgi:hypothetical protein